MIIKLKKLAKLLGCPIERHDAISPRIFMHSKADPNVLICSPQFASIVFGTEIPNTIGGFRVEVSEWVSNPNAWLMELK